MRRTLDQTAEVVLKWINSVENKEQLELVKKVVDTFITDRFTSAPQREMHNAREKIDLAIHHKEITILYPHDF